MSVKYYLCIFCSILISGLLIASIADVFEFKNYRRLYSRSTVVLYVRKRNERRSLRELSRGVRQRLAIRRHGRNQNPQFCPILRIDSKVRVGDMSRVFGGCRVLMVAAKAEAASPAAEKMQSGFLKPHPISPAMQKFVGASEISRNVAIKKIWEHIKLNQLQDTATKSEIHCDDKLKSIFDGRDKVRMLEISGLIASHFPKRK
ncbi:uncharacterized protein LOC103981684 [Musa acuminata AAA Group]|uniref:uncharacterized protein LOC103981684 n=1 Tax=Musa acuminata AAA Group TaxID=214697 RepID=UPI0031D4FC03